MGLKHKWVLSIRKAERLRPIYAYETVEVINFYLAYLLSFGR